VAKVPEAVAREYVGGRFRVVHCDGAVESYWEALKHVKAGKAKSFTNRMIAQIKRLAEGQPMSQGSFPKEGELPKQPGQQRTKHFYALKRIPIRGYCWRSKTRPDTYFISHYVYKDYDDLADRDIQKVGNNWRRVEEDGDDY
jgi:hypothetical protein|tara:strand:+ start:143 stop:568 length:426 start_codon:yes stop_codon:yes gene_type:complete